MSLSLSQSNPSKKGWALISSHPFLPSLESESQIILFKMSVEAGDNFASAGMLNVFFQCMIFWQVILGSSEKKGGYPTSISKRMQPTDHQSTVSSYPYYPNTSGAI